MRRVFMLIAGIGVGMLLLRGGGLSQGPEETSSPSPPRPSPSEIPRSPIAGIPFTTAVEIYQRHRKDLEQLPGVSAVGLSTEGIFVSTTPPSQLPAQVEGLPITVVPADHPGVSCGLEAHWHVTVGRCRRNVPLAVRRVGRQLLPPPPGVMILRPGGEREQAESCPPELSETVGPNNWRFCVDPNRPEPIPPLWEPPIAGIPYEEAQKILNRHLEELSRLPGVTNVGLGPEGIEIETYSPESVPRQVEGLPVITKPGVEREFMGHTETQPIRPVKGAIALRDTLDTPLVRKEGVS